MDKWEGQEEQEESRIEKKVRRLKGFKEAVISIRDYLSRLDVWSATEQEIFQQINFERFKSLDQSLDLYEVLKTLIEDGEIRAFSERVYNDQSAEEITTEMNSRDYPWRYYLAKPKLRPGIYRVKITPTPLIPLEDSETRKRIIFYKGQTLKVSGFEACTYFESAEDEWITCGSYLKECPGRVMLKQGKFCFHIKQPDGKNVFALKYDPEHTLFRLGIKKRRSINCSGM